MTAQTILKELQSEFIDHTIEIESQDESVDFSKRYNLIIDGTSTDIGFRPEVAQDLAVSFKAADVGISPLDPSNLLLPISERETKQAYNELITILKNDISHHITYEKTRT